MRNRPAVKRAYSGTNAIAAIVMANRPSPTKKRRGRVYDLAQWRVRHGSWPPARAPA